MSANFDLSALALAAICPGNEILYDDKGMPSIMVKIPKMTYAQLGMGESTAVHPAFIVNGQEVDAIYISKFMNIVKNSRAYSLPGQKATTDISFDTARQACEAKGAGWHLMTRIEWGLLIRWCQNNGVLPRGNNNNGKDASENGYKAIPVSEKNGKTAQIATGTGPLTWYHDQASTGIADLCGNSWEWIGGIRTVKGELQVLANNNAADPVNSQEMTSVAWRAINASDGTLTVPDGSGTTPGSIKLDWVNSKLTYSTTITDSAPGNHDCTFANVECDGSIGTAAQFLLASLGMLQYNGQTELFSGNRVYFNNEAAERLFYAGGSFYSPFFGVASFSGDRARSAIGDDGFRAAYVNLPTV